MVVVSQPFSFDEEDPRPMLQHLDSWARHSLRSPEAWAAALERCGQWVDYSARNQVLLASYGVVGPVAGATTWERVASTESGRNCAVRSGEHGLPVRVPVVSERLTTSERSRTGATSESVARGLRWEPVFALEQLARRPHPSTLNPVAAPKLSAADWTEVVRVASGRVLGRTPRKLSDPEVQLASLASRVTHGAGRVRLSDELAAQAGWLVADRLGLASVAMPAFDPVDSSAREKWRTLVDVRHAAGVVMDGVSHGLGVDLAQSPIPRHELVDDREVAPGRRNYLAPADLRALPLGVWIEAGPYSRSEWLSRGVAGAVGVGSFCRVNERSYLGVYEARHGAMWRLETTGRGTHHGLVYEGTADSLAEGKDAARHALRERFPDVARSIEVAGESRVVGASLAWMPMPGARDDRTLQRVIDDRVAAVVAPGPGGRWQTWATVDGVLRQGPLSASVDSAKDAADALVAGALADLAVYAPDRADRFVAELAASDSWDRSKVVGVVGHRLSDHDRQSLAATQDPMELVDALVATGVLAPRTILAVLRAEDVPMDVVVGLVPAIGLGVPEAIASIHEGWDADRLDVAASIGATVEELRAAGCTPTELLAAAPRETLRSLDSRESTWERVGPSLLEAGYTVGEAVAHIAAHAPTPQTFVAGVVTLVDDASTAFALSARRAGPEDLAALSERYGFDPRETARVLASASVPIDRAIETVHLRCDHDVEATYELASSLLGADGQLINRVLVGEQCAVLGLHAYDVTRELVEAASLADSGVDL
ncbi:MAG: hypothetical protein AB7V74_10645 [Acidimicrobiia bacterium]